MTVIHHQRANGFPLEANAKLTLAVEHLVGYCYKDGFTIRELRGNSSAGIHMRHAKGLGLRNRLVDEELIGADVKRRALALVQLGQQREQPDQSLALAGVELEDDVGIVTALRVPLGQHLALHGTKRALVTGAV